MKILLGLIFVVFVVFVIVFLAGLVIDSIQRRRDKNLKAMEFDVNLANKRVAIAERGLRQIANGISGNPVLEAQIILDDISNVRELS